MARISAALLAAACLAPLSAAAQEPAQTGADAIPTEASAAGAGILLELNGAVTSEAGDCRLTMVTTNRLGTALSRAAWQVAIFDAEGVVQALPILDFGALAAGKTKVALFELPQRPCDGIGRIVVNDVAACQAEDDSDLGAACLSGLETQSRVPIDFGL